MSEVIVNDIRKSQAISYSHISLQNLLSPSYKPRRVKNKGAFITFIWSFSVFLLFNYFLNSRIGKKFEIDQSTTLIIGVSTVFYPVAGWLSDIYFGRYKVISLSIRVLFVVGYLQVISLLLLGEYNAYRHLIRKLFAGTKAIGLLALGGYQANIIQFGIDQLVDASSSDISSYISWYIWIYVCTDTLVAFTQLCTCKAFSSVSSLILPFFLAVSWCADIFCNKWLVKEPATSNPLKLLFQVLRYAWKNKYPRQRSAFTYWGDQRYSRLDVAKNKYGGPFTTEQVEDVKIFFKIMIIVLTGSLFVGLVASLTETSINVMYHYHDGHYVDPKFCRGYLNCFERLAVHKFSSLIVVVFVPIFEVIIYPLLWKCLPRLDSMKKFIMGMILQLCYLIGMLSLEIISHHSVEQRQSENNITCVLSSTVKDLKDNTTLPTDFKWLLIPQVFSGMSIYFLVTSTLEFICAQSPYSMKGLIIGIIYGMLGVIVILVTGLKESFLKLNPLKHLPYGCGVWYYLVMTVLVVLLIVLACFISKWYTRRRRDENLHNEHMFATDYFDRYGSIAVSD